MKKLFVLLLILMPFGLYSQIWEGEAIYVDDNITLGDSTIDHMYGDTLPNKKWVRDNYEPISVSGYVEFSDTTDKIATKYDIDTTNENLNDYLPKSDFSDSLDQGIINNELVDRTELSDTSSNVRTALVDTASDLRTDLLRKDEFNDSLDQGIIDNELIDRTELSDTSSDIRIALIDTASDLRTDLLRKDQVGDSIDQHITDQDLISFSDTNVIATKYDVDTTNQNILWKQENDSIYLKTDKRTGIDSLYTNYNDAKYIDVDTITVGVIIIDTTNTKYLGVNSSNKNYFVTLEGDTILWEYYSATTIAPTLNFKKGRGTKENTTTVLDGDNLGNFTWNGYLGPGTVSAGAQILVEVDGDPGSTNLPGRLTIRTRDTGDVVMVDQFEINKVGNIWMNKNLTVDDSIKTRTVIADTVETSVLIQPSETASRGIYVETDGDDVTGDGTSGNPFATINGALSDIAQRLDDDVLDTIYLGVGTFQFTAADKSILDNMTIAHGAVILFKGTLNLAETGITFTPDGTNPFKYTSTGTWAANAYRDSFLLKGTAYQPICSHDANEIETQTNLSAGTEVYSVQTIINNQAASDNWLNFLSQRTDAGNISFRHIEFNSSVETDLRDGMHEFKECIFDGFRVTLDDYTQARLTRCVLTAGLYSTSPYTFTAMCSFRSTNPYCIQTKAQDVVVRGALMDGTDIGLRFTDTRAFNNNETPGKNQGLYFKNITDAFYMDNSTFESKSANQVYFNTVTNLLNANEFSNVKLRGTYENLPTNIRADGDSTYLDLVDNVVVANNQLIPKINAIDTGFYIKGYFILNDSTVEHITSGDTLSTKEYVDNSITSYTFSNGLIESGGNVRINNGFGNYIDGSGKLSLGNAANSSATYKAFILEDTSIAFVGNDSWGGIDFEMYKTGLFCVVGQLSGSWDYSAGIDQLDSNKFVMFNTNDFNINRGGYFEIDTNQIILKVGNGKISSAIRSNFTISQDNFLFQLNELSPTSAFLIKADTTINYTKFNTKDTLYVKDTSIYEIIGNQISDSIADIFDTNIVHIGFFDFLDGSGGVDYYPTNGYATPSLSNGIIYAPFNVHSLCNGKSVVIDSLTIYYYTDASGDDFDFSMDHTDHDGTTTNLRSVIDIGNGETGDSSYETLATSITLPDYAAWVSLDVNNTNSSNDVRFYEIRIKYHYE